MASFVSVAPDLIETAFEDLAGIRSTLSQAAAAAVAPTTGLLPAAADEISAAISQLFGAYGQEFQALDAQAAAFHAEFERLLRTSGAAYLGTELANASAAANAAEPLLGGLLGGIGGGSGGSAGGGLLGGLLGGGSGGGSGGLLGGLTGLLGGGTGGAAIPTFPGVIGFPSFPLSGIPPILGFYNSLPPIFAGPLGDSLGGVLTVFLNGGGTGLLTNPAPLLTSLNPLIRQVPGLQSILQGALPGLFGTSAAPEPTPPLNPYVALFQHTGTNLGLIASDFGAHPFPLLSKIAMNQATYLSVVGDAFANGIRDFPGGLQVLPGQFEAALASTQGFDPMAFAQWYGGRQATYFSILGTSLGNAGEQFQTTIPVFQADAGEAFNQLRLGNFNNAVSGYAKAAIDLFISGFDTSQLMVTGGIDLSNPLSITIDVGFGGPIGLEGPAGALLPILSIPAMQAQDFASLMPAGSSVQHMAQNYANVIGTLTNTAVSTDATIAITGSLLPPSLTTSFDVVANFGLPLQLAFAVMGTPFAAADGAATVLTYMGDSLQAGNLPAFAGAILNSPAIIMDSALNGGTYISLAIPVTVGGATLPLVMQLPLQGLLVPPAGIEATIDLLGIPLNVPVGGAKFGGLLPLLINGMPQQLAASIVPAAA